MYIIVYAPCNFRENDSWFLSENVDFTEFLRKNSDSKIVLVLWKDASQNWIQNRDHRTLSTLLKNDE